MIISVTANPHANNYRCKLLNKQIADKRTSNRRNYGKSGLIKERRRDENGQLCEFHKRPAGLRVIAP